jgi:DnaJ-class molecular chaperone
MARTRAWLRAENPIARHGKRVIKRICPECWGTGYTVVNHKKAKCATCRGTGQIEEEIDVRD